MKKWVLVLVALMGLIAAGAAFAQVEEEEKVVYKKVTLIPFEPGTIVGKIVGPANSYLPVKKGANFNLLIPVRDNFLPEMMTTASNL